MKMCGRRTLVGILVALVSSVFAHEAGAQMTEFRGFWADIFSPGIKSSAEIDTMVARAVTGHYNAIVAQVLAYHDASGSSHGAFWNSSVVPKNPSLGSFDPLNYLVARAHANGIEVHAWILPYRVSATWPPAGNGTIQEQWLMTDQAHMGGGRQLIDGVYQLDPGSPDVQDYLISIVRELVTNYDIDGINWDYIRFTQEDAGYPASNSYAKSGLARFRTITGYVGTPAPTGVASWDDFRRREVTELVRRARAEIAAIDSNPRQPLRHTADLFTTGGCPALFTATQAYGHRYSNWEEWLRLGFLDAGIPMNYDRESNPTEAAWFRNWIDTELASWRHNRHIFVGVAVYLNSFTEACNQITYARAAGANGIATYSYYATSSSGDDPSGTWYPWVATHCFSELATPPTMPWRNPATATEGTLWGRVTDGAGQPVDDAQVSLTFVGSVRTDGNGYYVYTMISGTPSGKTYNATAQKPGLGSRSSSVRIYAAGLTRQDFVLSCNPQVTIAADQTTIVEGESVHFTPNVSYSSGNTAASYVWHFGTELVSGTGAPTAIDRVFSSTGDFACYLVVTDTGGCTGESNHVNIHVNPGVPQVAITADLTTINEGQSVHFTPDVIYAPGGSGASYVWHFGTATIPGSGEPAAVDRVFSAAGDYDCYLSVTDTLSRTGESNHVNIHVDVVVYAYGDFDHDGDIDLNDFSTFRGCFNGPNRPYAGSTGCDEVDTNNDGDVDLEDFGAFRYCFNGPNRPPAQPGC